MLPDYADSHPQQSPYRESVLFEQAGYLTDELGFDLHNLPVGDADFARAYHEYRGIFGTWLDQTGTVLH